MSHAVPASELPLTYLERPPRQPTEPPQLTAHRQPTAHRRPMECRRSIMARPAPMGPRRLQKRAHSVGRNCPSSWEEWDWWGPSSS